LTVHYEAAFRAVLWHGHGFLIFIYGIISFQFFSTFYKKVPKKYIAFRKKRFM